LTISRGAVFQLFKYFVYILLAMNVYWFFTEEYSAAQLQFADGVGLGDLIEAYAATIDTFAWVVLLLMFELETYVLEDRHFTRPIALALHGLRAICYGFIVYAFYGYVVNLMFLDGTVPLASIDDLCLLADQRWSYATALDEYASITAANCGTFSTATNFLRLDGMQAVVDQSGLDALRGLARIDVINASVWLLVVLVLEIDVRLQEHNRLEGAALRISTFVKFVLYSTLLFAAVYWGIYGELLDFWDAFLWLVAFVFIELNVFEWRADELEQAAVTSAD
jgi:hypothetical protein